MFFLKICKCKGALGISVYSKESYRHYSILEVLKAKNFGALSEIKGWVKSVRNQKENVFVDVSDGSTCNRIQIVLPRELKPKTLSAGASIIANGFLSKSPKGDVELLAEEVQVVGQCAISEGYPLSPNKSYTSEYLRQHLHFRPRTAIFSSLLRIRNEVTLSIYEYFHSRGFINVNTPILTSNDCEGAGEVFKVLPSNKKSLSEMRKDNLTDDEVYFDCTTYLTVSSQLHLEAAAHGLSKVYNLGPVFRAENSRSRLHLSEFYMLEAEIAFIDNLNDLIIEIQDMLKTVTTRVLQKSEDEIEKHFKGNILNFDWLNVDFKVLTYEESLHILKKYQEEKFDESKGFSKEQEIFLVKHMGNVPTFITYWPKHLKPFYMKEFEKDVSKVCALDLLVPNIGELIGGSVRENQYKKLKANIPKELNNLNWYADLRKFGSVPTAGYGLGFERYLQFILGITNIKDTIPFPRWPHNCSL